MSTKMVRLTSDWWREEREPAKSVAVRPARPKLSAKYYTPDQLAERFQTSLDPWYDAIRSGDLIADKIGRLWRISEEALLDYLALKRRNRA